MCRKYFEKWRDALTKPKETFRKERKNASLKEAAKHIGLAGLIAGAISAAITLLTLSSAAFSIIYALFLLILTPISSILSLIIGSSILYLLAKLFGGKGDYSTQTYLLSLYQAPMLLLTTMVAFIPLAGAVINIAIAVYSLYLLTLALKETHNYSTGRAVATWLLSMIILAVVAALAVFAYFVSSYSYYASLLGSLLPYSP